MDLSVTPHIPTCLPESSICIPGTDLIRGAPDLHPSTPNGLIENGIYRRGSVYTSLSASFSIHQRRSTHTMYISRSDLTLACMCYRPDTASSTFVSTFLQRFPSNSLKRFPRVGDSPTPSTQCTRALRSLQKSGHPRVKFFLQPPISCQCHVAAASP